MRKLLLCLFLSALPCFPQAAAVNQVDGPTTNNIVTLPFYDGSSRLLYACYAPALIGGTTQGGNPGVPAVWSTAASTLTSIVVSSNTGTITLSSTAYFWVGQQVTVAGSATTALNGTYKIQTVSGSTATITTSGVSNGTYADAALVLSTLAPMLNATVWSIKAISYVTAGIATAYWAGTPSSVVPGNLACSNRANY